MADLSRVLCEDDGVPERPDHPGTRISGQLHGGTLDDVGGRIVGGALAPGAVLTLDRLSHEYAVSVSVARQVVRVLESMGNEMFGSLGDVVAEVLTGRTRHGLMPDRPNPEAIALHDTIARAVRTGNATEAERAMRELIEEAAEAMSRELDG